MKWFKKTAQGFNPGLVGEKKCPESGTRIWDRFVEPKYEYREHAYRAPLSGRIVRHAYPGLKPWAVLLDHFMVKNSYCECPPNRTGRSQVNPVGTITDYCLTDY